LRRWQTIRSSVLARHIHKRAYCALVLSGRGEEAGDSGRFRVQVGDVLLHECFEGHQNRFPSPGMTVLNIALPVGCWFLSGLGRVADLDFIVRLAERDEQEAAKAVLSEVEMQKPVCFDWPDELAFALLTNPSLSLSCWSAANGIAPWETSRGFAAAFGISPSAFRARTRARLAWRAIRTSEEPLAGMAARLGFADQSHMTRSVTSVTGRGPRAWRASANRFKTQ